MRLIDVSKMMPDACLATALDKGESFFSYFYSENRIENAPTIKAIPIKWLKQWEKNYNETVIKEILEDWEKENEINN